MLAKAGALLLLVLLVALSITPTTAAAAAVGPDDDVPDPFAGVRGIVLRLLGEGKGQGGWGVNHVWLSRAVNLI